MTRYVVDASVAVEYLLRTPVGETVADLLDNAVLLAPELLDAEVLSVLRRLVLHGQLAETRALLAVDDLVHWPVERISPPHPRPSRLAVPQEPQRLRRPLRRHRPRPRPPPPYHRRPPRPRNGPGYLCTICPNGLTVQIGRLEKSEQRQ